MQSNVVNFLHTAAAESAANTTVWVAAISASAGALVGITAGVLSFLGTLKSAKSHREAAVHVASTQLETVRLQLSAEVQKLRATHVTTERLRWLRELRNLVAEFYSNMDHQLDILVRAGEQAVPDKEHVQRQLDELESKINVQYHTIMLILNPDKPEQEALIDAIGEAQGHMEKLFHRGSVSDIERDEYQNFKSLSFSAMTKIGAKAWRKVQDLG